MSSEADAVGFDVWLSNPDSPKTCSECGSDDIAKVNISTPEETRRWVLNRCRNCQHSF